LVCGSYSPAFLSKPACYFFHTPRYRLKINASRNGGRRQCLSMNRSPSSHPSPPVGEKVPGGRLRGIPIGSWLRFTSEFWRCPLPMSPVCEAHATENSNGSTAARGECLNLVVAAVCDRRKRRS